MADPIRQLFSQTSFDTDGTTTVWNFSFAGGYIDQSHVKVQTLDKATGVITQMPIGPADFIGQFQLELTPAFPNGLELTIYRDTPKDLPLVDFMDKASFTEGALDLNARQAIFVAAESADGLNVAIDSVAQIVNFVENARVYSETATAASISASASAATASSAEVSAIASALAAGLSEDAAAQSAASAASAASDAITDDIATARLTLVEKTSSTGAALIPFGTTAQRPAGSAGHLRLNDEEDTLEVFKSGSWEAISSGLPTIVGKALNFLRVRADEGGYEHRTAAQVRADIVPPASIVAADLATGVMPLGVGQTWQNVKALRAYATIYTNTTGRTIAVSIVGSTSVLAVVDAAVDGITLFSASVPADYNITIPFLVPNGSTYAVAWSGGVTIIITWAELTI